ncbi:DNA replication/repair protein RecF [Moraxella sp. ZJ142]|uniref:DNA replication/repair protein RecF n=1 Tax=Moraxella marmotae TaxID=3344520 RepID=UPI0035D3EF0D
MINKLQIHNLRNLEQVAINLAACNLVIGANGSGKTSLLEAVFLLSRGKSFRHHESKRYICHHQTACTVWATTFDGQDLASLAIQKQINAVGKSDTLLRYNEQTATSQSVLSLHLPVLLIDPVGMGLLDEGSTSRRQLLDWLAFHMKPEFYQQWLQYQRLLKQRNALLKNPAIHRHLGELSAWDRQLSDCAVALHHYRYEVFEQWVACFDDMLKKLLPAYQDKLSLQYLAGFDTKDNLLDILNNRLNQDIELGYTRIGAHRADVLVILKQTNSDGQKLREQATHVLSRGEKKLLITALRLSQLQLICQAMSRGQITLNNPPMVLIDDIDAELDNHAIDVLLDTVLSLPCQSLISSLNPQIHHKITQKLDDLAAKFVQCTADDTLSKQITTKTPTAICQPKTYHMFHVEQGKLSLMDKIEMDTMDKRTNQNLGDKAV